MHLEETLTNDVVRAKDVISVEVKNSQKENLGKIKDIVLDKISGQVRYIVLSFGGFLGLGDKLFAIPWKAIHYLKEDECFILDINKEKLKSAPGFDDNDWPDMADREWETTIHSFYGTKPYWE